MNNFSSKLTHEDIFFLLSDRFDNNFLSLKDLPPPSKFKDIDKAVERIYSAIKNNEKIIVIGDYDVDGVVSTSVMKLFFDEISYPINWIIPNRFRDGYGLSTTLLPKIEDYDLIITVDNGISAIEAADECKKLGIDLIITDHHIVPEVAPDAYATINQKQNKCNFPYEEICGAQIAWYLCVCINKKLDKKIDMKSYLELVSIAIIADIMPLKHINRAMVQAGIRLLNQSKREFVKVYKEQTQKYELTAEDIAFSLAPILNSAGRLEDALLAVEYICTNNSHDAKVSLDNLISLNERRKELEQQITDEALEMADKDDNVIIVSSKGWHEGVVGIVAARVSRQFEKPAIVLSQNDNVCKGSGRSFNNCNLFELVDTQRDLLEKFGGHSAAIGMSISITNLENFKQKIDKKAYELCSKEPYIDPDIIGELSFENIDFVLIDMIAQFEPFGHSNAKPKFISKSVEILAVSTMGKDANHLRFTFRESEVIYNAVQFKTYESYEIGEIVDIVYTVNKNHFRGDTTIQLMIEKIKRH